MHPTSVRQRIAESQELRILRQDNLAVYADINQRAFRGEGIAHVPLATYLRTIQDVQNDLAPGENDTFRAQPAKTVLGTMLGRSTASKGEPWIGTDERGGIEYVVLLDAGSRALKIVAELGVDHSLDAQSSLDSLTKDLALIVARLSNDAAHQIEALSEQAEAIAQKIRHLERHGAKPLEAREREQEIQGVLTRLIAIKAGFARIPAKLRLANGHNQDAFLGINQDESTTPMGAVMNRHKAWKESGEHAVLKSLLAIGSGPTAQSMREHLGRLAGDEQNALNPDQRHEMARFLPDMVSTARDIGNEEHAIWQAIASYIGHPEYEAMRDEAWAMRQAMEAVASMRDALQPTPRDKRIAGLGLAFDLPARGAAHPAMGLRLNAEPPKALDQPTLAAAPPPPPDKGKADLRNAMSMAKSQWLSQDKLAARVAKAMQGKDRVRLHEVLALFPPRYGRQEIGKYLALAAEKVPAVMEPDVACILTITERGKKVAAQIANPTFLRSGPPGQHFERAAAYGGWMGTEALREAHHAAHAAPQHQGN